jgi:hypothetical protein
MEKKRYGVKTSLLKEPRQLSLKKKRKMFYNVLVSGITLGIFPLKQYYRLGKEEFPLKFFTNYLVDREDLVDIYVTH